MIPSQYSTTTSNSHKGRDSIANTKKGKHRSKPNTTARHAPVTGARLPATAAGDTISAPGVARADTAPSAEKPEGDREWAANNSGYTPLQTHVRFWDKDDDGQIYPWDTYTGFRELGFNILFSLIATVVINGAFSYPTRLGHSLIPDPWFRIFVPSIHKAKHGSDSGTYDPEGRFVPQAFENIFSKYDSDKDGALTFFELFSLIHGHRCAMDPFGWTAAFLEWMVTWVLVQKDNKVYKEDMRAIYDVSGIISGIVPACMM
jgi:peroxygenase